MLYGYIHTFIWRAKYVNRNMHTLHTTYALASVIYILEKCDIYGHLLYGCVCLCTLLQAKDVHNVFHIEYILSGTYSPTMPARSFTLKSGGAADDADGRLSCSMAAPD